MDPLTIGRLAGATGVTVETIRYYERRRLLPGPERSANGYRRYTSDDVWRVAFIRRAQRYGFSLREIAELLEAARSGPCDGVRVRAEERLHVVEAEIERLQRVRARLVALVDACGRGLEDECLTLPEHEGSDANG